MNLDLGVLGQFPKEFAGQLLGSLHHQEQHCIPALQWCQSYFDVRFFSITAASTSLRIDTIWFSMKRDFFRLTSCQIRVGCQHNNCTSKGEAFG